MDLHADFWLAIKGAAIYAASGDNVMARALTGCAETIARRMGAHERPGSIPRLPRVKLPRQTR